MRPEEYERVRSEDGYAVRRIEALTSALTLVRNGYEYPAPRHDRRRRLSRRAMRARADEALDPDYLSRDD